MKNNIETLLYNIKINIKESSNQSDLFTKYHTRFNVTMEYKNITYNTDYQCNTNYTNPSKNDVLACVLSDARCYESCKINDDDNENIQEFALEFGYENNLKELLKAYAGCKNAYNHIEKMFTNEEKELLYSYFEEEGLL